MCRQFSCLPSQLEDESADILRLLMIEQMGTPEQGPDPMGEVDG